MPKVRDCADCIHHYPRNPTWKCELEQTPDTCSARLYPPKYVATGADIRNVFNGLTRAGGKELTEYNNVYDAPDQTRGWQEWASQLLADMGATRLLPEGEFDHDAARALIQRLMLEAVRQLRDGY